MQNLFKTIKYYGQMLFALAFVSNALYGAELDKQLSKIEGYKRLTNLVDNNEDIKKGTNTFQSYLENRKKEVPPTPSEQAKLIYEKNIDAKPCGHCPKYLNLTLAVNEIVEKVKADQNVARSNEALIQLNKLKFLYYVVRSENDQGEISCSKLGERDYFNPSKLDGNFNMLSETMIKMPEVTDMQYIPKGKEEVYYYYRGEGDKSNVVIEVLMKQDGTARMRYYDFDSHQGPFGNTLPSLGSASERPVTPPRGENEDYMDFNFDIKTRNTAIPTDINFLKAGASTQVAEDVNLKLKNQINFNEQTASMAVESDKGEKYLVLEGKNITDGGKSFNTIIPVEINLDKSTQMKVSGSLENQLSASDMKKVGNFELEHTQTVKLGLTDHNHEYFNVKAVTDREGLANYSVSSKYSLGESSSVAATYEEGRDGQRAFMVSNVASFSKNQTLTTSYGTSSDSKRGFIQTQYENKIGENTSLIIGAKMGDEKTVSLIFQSKF